MRLAQFFGVPALCVLGLLCSGAHVPRGCAQPAAPVDRRPLLRAVLEDPVSGEPALPITKDTLPTPRELPRTADVPALEAPQIEAGDRPMPINLAAALKLADARPLIVVAAQASVWVAEAQLTRARLLWVPALEFSSAYVRHDGFGPDFNRGINTPERPMNQNINFLYSGFGLINTTVETTEMIFQPLVKRQVLNSRKWDIQTAKNDALLQTANAYFSVHQWRGCYAGALDVVAKGNKLVERIDAQSKDLVPRAEVDRARRMLAELQQKAASTREAWRVNSADLTQILRLDPRVIVVPLEADYLQVTLIDPSRPLDDLMPTALLNRPELASQKALVEAAVARIREEKLRPFLPTLFLNGFQTPGEKIQAGVMGIGPDGNMNLWSPRSDITPQLSVAAESMGLGNLARVKEKRGEQSQAMVELFKIQDRVSADVVRTQARLQSAAVRAVQAERGLREGLITYQKNYEGLRQTSRFGNVLVQIYRPQEAVAALEHLSRAYDEYFGAIADYNRAQFQMFHALGYPAGELAYERPPGDDVPVDTERPSFLPPTGVGPPPATR